MLDYFFFDIMIYSDIAITILNFNVLTKQMKLSNAS